MNHRLKFSYKANEHKMYSLKVKHIILKGEKRLAYAII